MTGLLLLLAMLAGCGADASSSAEKPAGAGQSGASENGKQENAPETIRIGVLPIADSFPLYAALEKELFAQQGLQVEIIPFQSGSDQSVAYEAGELDGMMTDMIVQSLVNLSTKEKGMKVVAMALGGTAEEGRFLVASSPDSGILEPEQLKGKKIGISENTMMEYLVRAYLEDMGIDPDETEMVNIPKLTLRLDLLMEGSDIQAAILPDPLAIEAESRGCAAVIDDTKLGKNYSQSVVTLRSDLIEASPDAAKAFVAAYNAAIDMINEDPSSFEELFYEKANVAEPLQGKYTVPSYTADVVPTEEEVAAIGNFLTEKGLLENAFSYEEMVWTPS